MSNDARQNRWKWIPETDPDKLCALLEARQMTQSDLARAIGVHPSRVNRLCARPFKARGNTVDAICAAIGCEKSELIH
jgi:DNA-binding Xre family transcriptional regulator